MRSRTLRVFPKPSAFNITEITAIDVNDFFRTSRHYGVLRYRRFRFDPVSISSELLIEELLIKRLHLFLEQKRKQYENSIRGIQEYKHICENDIDDVELVISRPVDSSEKETNDPSEAHNNGHLDIELNVLIARQLDARKPSQIVLFLSSFLLTNVVNGEEVVDGINNDYNRNWKTEEKEVGRSISDPARAAHYDHIVRFVLLGPLFTFASKRLVFARCVRLNNRRCVFKERVFQHLLAQLLAYSRVR